MKKFLQQLNQQILYPCIPKYNFNSFEIKNLLNKNVEITEKIEGEKFKIIYYNNECILDIKDVYANNELNILKDVKNQIKKYPLLPDTVYIFYGVLYGYNIKNYHRYTSSKKNAYKIFDVAVISKDKIKENSMEVEPFLLSTKERLALLSKMKLKCIPLLIYSKLLTKDWYKDLHISKAVLDTKNVYLEDKIFKKAKGIVIKTTNRDFVGKINFE